MAYTKVFVGNLSFKTRGQDLAGEFAAVGKVIDANIITRGNRSLGYGFVDMDTEENAQKAVSLMNKKLVDGRDINVELARPRDEEKIAERKAAKAAQQAERSPSAPRQRRGRRNNGPKKTEGAEQNAATTPKEGEEKEAAVGDAEKSPAARGKRRPRKSTRKPRASAEPEKEGSSSSSSAASASAPAEGKEAKAPRRRPRKPRRSVGNPDENSTETPKEDRTGAAVPGRRRRRNSSRLEGGTPSPSSLFVANLPFAVDNAALEEAFAAHHVKSAKVIMNKYGRSKGFGFVELETEKDQKEALEAMHDKPLQGRNIAVKVAIVLKPREDADAAATPNAEVKTPNAAAAVTPSISAAAESEKPKQAEKSADAK